MAFPTIWKEFGFMFAMLVIATSDGQSCQTRGCNNAQRRTFHYAGGLKCLTGNPTVRDENERCTDTGRRPPPSTAIVTSGANINNLPNYLICFGRNWRYRRCVSGSSSRNCQRERWICRKLDVTHPTASCPDDIDTDARLQKGTTATVDFVTSCSDNVDTGIQAVCNATSQSEFPVGVTTVNCSCEDLSQNTDECSFTITVKDVTHPNASCPNDKDTDARLQEGTTARVDFVTTCSDNIDAGIQAACNATSQSEFPVGVTTVTCSCEDLSQNTDECSFTITVKDVTHPNASCPNDKDTDARLQEGTTATVDFVTKCSDNVDTGIQATCNATSQSEFPVGVTTVTCSCEDLSKNTDECSFIVKVKDVTHPTASCPDDIDTDARLQKGTTARVDFVTKCSDNVDTGIQAVCNATSQSEFPVGVTTVNCSCEDLSQNTDGCSFTITVKDVTHPNASCPNDVDTDARLQEGTTARVNFVTSCSDNIDTGIQASCNATSQSEFPVGVTTVTCSCEDLSQNTDECSFTITVKDVTHPNASCPNDKDTDARLQEGTTATVDFVTSCSDNVDTGIQATCNATSQSEFPVGVTTVTCSCEDLSKNTDECSFIVKVKDVTHPTASCPDDIDTDARLQKGTTARVDFVTKCSDNVDTGIQAVCNATSQSEFPVGVTTVNCSCEDLSQNTDGCSFTITVKDVTHPNASCPNDVDTDARLQEGTTARVNFVTSCSDNIDTGIQASCNATSQSEFPVGVTTVTCSCEDLSQNTDECSFTITVKDVTHPNASCPNDKDTDARLQEGTTATVDFVTKCSDNVDTGIQATCNATSQSEFPVGVTTVTCSCEDLSKNTDECSFIVKVKDVTHPNASCPNDIDTDARLQEGTTATVDFVPSCSDNVDKGIQATCNATSQSEFPVGVTTVTCSCEDLSKNTDECSFIVKVKDVTHPNASCPNDIDTDAKLQEGTTARVDFVTSCSDNIDTGIQASCNATSQNEFPVGVTTVTCFCEDLSENTDGCSFTVTVKDVTEPNATCPGDITTDATEESKTTARVTFVASCPDNIEMGIQPNCNATSNQTMFSVGVTTVTCLCEDASQNINDCSFNVIVKGYCYEDRYDYTPDMRLQFQKTEVNENKGSNEKCPSGKPRALRNCSLSVDGKAIWSNPVLMECFEKANNTKTLVQNTLKGLAKTSNVTTENAGFVAEDLETTINVVREDTTSLTKEVIDDVVNVFETLSKVVNQTQNVTKSVINTIDKFVYILDNTEEQVPQTSTKPSTDKLLLALEAQVMALGANDGNFSKSGEMFDICVTHISPPLELTFPSVNEEQVDNSGQVEIKDEEKSKVSASIKLPQEILDDYFKGETLIPISLILHHSEVLFQDPAIEKEGKKIGSAIISVSTLEEINNLTSPVVLTFKLNENVITEHEVEEKKKKPVLTLNDCTDPPKIPKPTCVFWDHATAGWSTEGCQTIHRTNDNYTVCRCTHLTTFAVLMDWQGDIKKHGLTIFSQIGCAVSVFSLAVTILTFLSIKKLRSSRPQQIILQICIALLGLDIFFLVGIDRTELALACDIVAALIHFFCLASVAWMSTEATYMYLLFVQVSSSNDRYFMQKASVIGWGLPAVIVITNVLLEVEKHEEHYKWNHSYISTCQYCFLDNKSNGFRFGLVAVLAVFLTYNLLLFIMIAWKLSCGRKRLKSSSATRRQQVVRRMQNVSAISILLGITWISGFLSIGPFQLVSNIIFCVSNSLQGFFIFLLFCVRQKDIRSAWKNSILARPLTTSLHRKTSRRPFKLSKHIKVESQAQATDGSSEMTRLAKRNTYEDFTTTRAMLSGNEDVDCAAAALASCAIMEPTSSNFVSVQQSPDFICHSPSMATSKGQVGQLIDIDIDSTEKGLDLSPPSPLGTNETPYPGPLTVVPPKESPSFDRGPPSPIGTMETPYSGPLIVVPPKESLSFDRGPPSPLGTMETPYSGPLTVVPPKESPSSDRVPPSPLGTMETPYSGPLIVVPPQESPSFDRVSTSSDAKHTTENPYAMFIAATNTGGTLSTAKVIDEGDNSPLLGPPIKNKDYN
ncbi:uncharacterized protein [Apostichopus japonicus]|uniref:uncharacterized protein isoform X5 n=1 Tax=Stichopus japonicus TaxID=307972 RepID=UPI003AB3EB43